MKMVTSFQKGKVLTASCVAEGSLDLWDLGSGTLITKIDPSNKPVYLYGEFPYAAQFHKGAESEGDLVLCGGAGLGGLQVISVEEQAVSTSLCACHYFFKLNAALSAIHSSYFTFGLDFRQKSYLFLNVSCLFSNSRL